METVTVAERSGGKTRADGWMRSREGWGSKREELSMCVSREGGAEGERLEP